MRIEEGEGGVFGERDALAGRRQALPKLPAAGDKRRGQRHDGVEIERALDHVGQAVEMRHQVGMLAGLDQAEMALRQGERRVAQDRADDRHAERFDRLAGTAAVALAGEPVEHDAGDAHVRVVGGKALGDGRGRLRLAGDIEHQQHRQA